MKKVAIIGAGDSGKTIEVIKKAIEEKLGEELELVHVNAEDKHGMYFRDFTPPPIIQLEIKSIDRSCCDIIIPKRKGHERPYKYHR